MVRIVYFLMIMGLIIFFSQACADVEERKTTSSSVRNYLILEYDSTNNINYLESQCGKFKSVSIIENSQVLLSFLKNGNLMYDCVKVDSMVFKITSEYYDHNTKDTTAKGELLIKDTLDYYFITVKIKDNEGTHYDALLKCISFDDKDKYRVQEIPCHKK